MTIARDVETFEDVTGVLPPIHQRSDSQKKSVSFRENWHYLDESYENRVQREENYTDNSIIVEEEEKLEESRGDVAKV